MRTLVAFATVSSILILQATVSVFAQSAQAPASERRFEVASVKPSLSLYERARLAAPTGAGFAVPRSGIRIQPGGRFTAIASLKQLIAEAFEVMDYQIDGGPPWLASDHFEITANAGANATPADVKAMLRVLLAERFGLRTRSDTRQAPVHVLTIARSDGRLGSRLTRSTPECVQQIEQQRIGTVPTATPDPALQARGQNEVRERMKRIMSGDLGDTRICGSMNSGSSNGVSTFVSSGIEMTSLVSRISGELSAPVVDRTELSGLFDVTLEYLSEKPISGRPAGLDPNSTDPLPPSLTGALQQQLGLKLEKQIGPLPVVIIQAADRPTPD